MKNLSGIVKQFGQLVADAERVIADSIAANRVPDEPSITNRFLQELESSINRINHVRGIQFLATTLTSLGPNAEESTVGADFLGILSIQIPGMSVSKGFLCQAKRSGNGVNINWTTQRNVAVGFTRRTEFQNLQQQVGKMLSITPDSFLCVYSQEGFAFVPAISVHGLTYSNDGNEVYAKNTRLFFSEFMMCFIGDRFLGATDEVQVSRLAEQTRSRYAFRVDVKSLS